MSEAKFWLEVEATRHKPYPGGGYTIETERQRFPFGRGQASTSFKDALPWAQAAAREFWHTGQFEEVLIWRRTAMQGKQVQRFSRSG